MNSGFYSNHLRDCCSIFSPLFSFDIERKKINGGKEALKSTKRKKGKKEKLLHEKDTL